jgi:hypothetical protein
MTQAADCFTPDPEVRARYEVLYNDVYKRLFLTVRPLVDRLSQVASGAMEH